MAWDHGEWSRLNEMADALRTAVAKKVLALTRDDNFLIRIPRNLLNPLLACCYAGEIQGHDLANKDMLHFHVYERRIAVVLTDGIESPVFIEGSPPHLADPKRKPLSRAIRSARIRFGL